MSELQNKIWKVLLKETEKENLRRGDHIYTWTKANAKNHGIYLNDDEVIHFTQTRREARSDVHHSTCPECRDRDQSSFHGVVSSCVDCFLSGGDHLYLFEYGVNPALFLGKLGVGTTLALTDPADVVKDRASGFLGIKSSDSGRHYRFINDGKDFAMYCKTGLLVIDNINFGRSWQTAFFLAITVAVFLSLKQITAATFTGVAARCFGLYCIYRFGSDMGVRPNVIKVDQVEKLPDVDEKLSSAALGFRPIQSLIDLFIVLLMTHFNIQLLLRVLMWSKTLQLRSETPRGVWILAWIIFCYSAILQKRWLSNKIHRKQLKPGDHIYTWRRGSTYAHHGIYVCDKKVINLVRGEDHILPSSASSHSSDISSSTRSSAASNQAKKTRVEYCSLDSFLDGDELYLYKYGVSLAFFIAKTRGGTCALGSTDPPKSVLYRARQELKGFGAYNLLNNNCEDFAIYCKTGLRSRNRIINLGRNGQIASYFGAFYAIIIFIFTFLTNNPIDVAATVYFIYSMFRFVADATSCGKTYQVRLKILPPWRRRGRFPVIPQFMDLQDKILIF